MMMMMNVLQGDPHAHCKQTVRSALTKPQVHPKAHRDLVFDKRATEQRGCQVQPRESFESCSRSDVLEVERGKYNPLVDF